MCVLLEVGLGGRLDATNVIDQPLATRHHAGQHGSHGVSRRHAERDRRREGRHHQARRAGDLRRAGAGGDGGDRSAGGAHARAAACGRRSNGTSASSAAGWSIRTSAACWIWRRRNCSAGISSTMPDSRSRRCARSMRSRSECPRIEAGIVGAEWPARMQRLTAGALVDPGPQACEIWLDGGHNRRRRPRRCRRARRSRRAGVAPAGGDRRHDGEQGCAARSSPISPA